MFTNNTLSIFAQENNSIENRTILKKVDIGNSKKNINVKNNRLNTIYDKLDSKQFNNFTDLQKGEDELSNQIGTFKYNESATSQGITLKVEWNDPVLGKETTFHVSATGGSGKYKFSMEVPGYTDPDVLSYESVADPDYWKETTYTSECSSQDYKFTMMASGTYHFRFYVMDKTANMYYLRTNFFI